MCSGAQSRSWHHQLGPAITSSSSAFVIWAWGCTEALSGLSRLLLGEGLQKIWAALLFLQHVLLPFWTGKYSVRGGSLVSGTVVNLFRSALPTNRGE